MKLVTATEAMIDVDTCARHGVWFDGGDLVPVVRAVARTLGKPIPKVATTLGAQADAARPTPTLSSDSGLGRTSFARQRPAARSRVAARSSSGPVRDVATGINDVSGGAFTRTGNVLGEVADIAVGVAVLPFDVTFAVVGGLCDLLD